jgi:uncharacterized membrane protein
MNITKKILLIALACIVMSIAISTAANASGGEWNWDDTTADEAGVLGGLACLSGVMCILPIIAIVIGIILAIWVYKDAEKRGSSGPLWLIIVLLTGIIGLIIWLVIRPPIGGKPGQQGTVTGRTCPSCGRPIPMDAQICPYCGNKFSQ